MEMVKPSTWVENSVLWPPMENHVNRLVSMAWRNFSSPSPTSGRLIHWMAAATDQKNEKATAGIPISWPFQGRRFPMRMISQNDTAGTANTGHTLVRKNMPSSALQQIDVGDVDRAPVPVDEQHDGQADADLGG